MKAITLTLALALGGCAALDPAFGVGHDQNGKPVVVDPGGGVIGGAGRLANQIPGWGWLIGLLTSTGVGIYQTLRVRGERSQKEVYLDAASRLVKGVDQALDQGRKPAVSKDELYAVLDKLRLASDFADEIGKFVAQVKNESRNP